MRTLVKETLDKIGKTVSLNGWVDSIRDHGKITFLDLRDRSGKIQCVGKDLPKVTAESVVEIVGIVAKRPEKLINPKFLTGSMEIQIKELKVLAASQELPFDISKADLKLELPTLLDHRTLTLRHPKIKAIFKVEETIIQAFRKALMDKDFTEFEAPTIVPVATEGGAEVFSINYYDYNAYLAQSPQLYKQIMVSVFERAFTVGRAYRAEPSITTRHLSEYITLDCEFGFINSWTDLMDMAEYMLRKVFSAVENDCQSELSMYESTLPKLSAKIPRLKMREAQQIIFERTGRDNRKEPDLEPEDEREICRWALEKHDSELVFVTHYPTNKRPFYTFPDPEDPEYTYSFDLLGRGLEWITGGQRINDYQTLVNGIKKKGLKPEDFEMYLKAFRYGMPPEGGFALGAERITSMILGLGNVREASLFPRDMERVDVRLSTIQKPKNHKSK